MKTLICIFIFLFVNKTICQPSVFTFPKSKVALTKAADVRDVHPTCNENLAPKSSENSPLINMYCGVLGKKPIEIYILSQNTTQKTVSGFSKVGNNKVYFEGKYSSKLKKGSARKDILDFDEMVYSLTLFEPKTSLKNGAFKLNVHLNDTYSSAEGFWISYDGMLNREIIIYDRMNPDF